MPNSQVDFFLLCLYKIIETKANKINRRIINLALGDISIAAITQPIAGRKIRINIPIKSLVPLNLTGIFHLN